MLTPVSSNMPVSSNTIGQQTALRGHGSAPRDTSNHGQVEAPAVAQAPHHAATIGLDAGTVLSNVNAVAATAGSRTVLQMLALAVAAQVNIARRNDESMEAFFLRLVAILENMKPDEQAATEARTGLKLLQISLPQLAAALKQPDSALAARLSAMAEAPMATPQKTAAASATTSYLQEEPGAARAAETQAMVNQAAKANTSAIGLFSSTPHPQGGEMQSADAKGLQGQLKNLFEPGMADTRDEIAAASEAQTVLILGSSEDFAEQVPGTKAESEGPVPPTTLASVTPMAEPDPSDLDATLSGTESAQQPMDANPEDPAELPQNNVMPTEQEAVTAKSSQSQTAHPPLKESLPSATTAEADIHAEEKPAPALAKPDQRAADQQAQPRSQALLSAQNTGLTPAMRIRVIAQELAQANVISTGDEPRIDDKGGRQVQTLLALKGIAEVTTAPAVVANAPANLARTQPHEAMNHEANSEPDTMPMADTAASIQSSKVTGHSANAEHAQPQQVTTEIEDAEVSGRSVRADEAHGTARSPDPEALAQPRQIANAFHPVPYAYATLQLATDEFKPEATDDRRRDDDEEGNQGQEREDEEARRERLARKATDDLLRPEADAEPALNITRDSSQSDRAYALYQRMGGF